MHALALLLTLLFLSLIVVSASGDGAEGGSTKDSAWLLPIILSVLLSILPEEFGYDAEDVGNRLRSPCYPLSREHKRVHEIFNELGPSYTRRAYRMTAVSFWNLHRILLKYLRKPPALKQNKKVMVKGTVNGVITTPIRLSAALRYFAGGRPEDIALVHGISHTEGFHSVWMVVDAVNASSELAFLFPEDHDKQRAIAEAFKSKSQVGFDNCVGTIDGLLVWTKKFSDEECCWAGVGPKKFFCGRKHKFGLNLQGTCDAENRFIDVSINHPASTSDFLAFSTLSLYHKEDGEEGFPCSGALFVWRCSIHELQVFCHSIQECVFRKQR
jgi:DDE superfamily endonuclease